MKIHLICLFLLTSLTGFSQVSDKQKMLEKLSTRESINRTIPNLNTSLAANNYDMKYHRCEWYIDPNNYYINGNVTSYFVITVNSTNQIEFDFSDIMTVDSVYYHGSNVSHAQANNVLQVTLTNSLNAGTLDSLTVFYQGAPPATGFGSFSQNFHNSIPIIATLSEPYGASDWWPCKQSLDDKIDSIDIIITTPQQYRAGTNGVLLSETTVGNDKIYHWKSKYPITAYLVGIAVTEYAVYSEYLPLSPSDTLDILNYVYPEDSLVATTQTPFIKDVIALYDSLFITYPFYKEKYGHCQWNWGGGEEHQTMSFVSDFNGSLIAHECAHQWFGDYVTCSSFQDVWLNEGFATYLEALTEEFLLPPGNWTSWKASTRDDITSVPNGSVFCTDTTNVFRIFDGRLTYEKGAFLLHMLRWKMGDSAFFQSLKNYLNDSTLAFNYANTDDLKNHLEAASGLNLTNFFNQWYYNQGYPSYTISYNVNGFDLFVKIEQTQSDPSVTFFEMPVPIEFQNGLNDTILVFENTYSGQLFQSHINFNAATATFDPEIWILSANNSVTFDPTLGVNDFSKNNKVISLFPNPVLNKLMIRNNGKSSVATVILKNSVGQTVHTESRMLNTGNNEINVSGIVKGIYFLSVQSVDFTLNTKIVKE